MTIMLEGVEYWTVSEIAKYYNVVSVTVHDWIKKGYLKAIRDENNYHGYIISKSDVINFNEQRTIINEALTRTRKSRFQEITNNLLFVDSNNIIYSGALYKNHPRYTRYYFNSINVENCIEYYDNKYFITNFFYIKRRI